MSRETCLCNRHANMALKLKCLRRLGINIHRNPEVVVRNVTRDDLNEMLAEIGDDQEVEYEQWKHVDEDGKKRMRVVTMKERGESFKTLMTETYEEFIEHCERVRTQFEHLKLLKENLPEKEVIIQMDFSENFTSQATSEPQSAFFNPTGITLHPVVLYWREASENGDLQLRHKSFVFVSDELNHN